MFSKLSQEAISTSEQTVGVGSTPDLQPVLKRLGLERPSVFPIRLGILTQTYIISDDNISLFVKTHNLEKGSKGLAREFHCLKYLYGEKFFIDTIIVQDTHFERCWLITAQLAKNTTPIDPSKINEMLSNLSLNLLEKIIVPEIKNRSIEFLLLEASKAISNLEKGSLLAGDAFKFAQEALEILWGEVHLIPKCVCHGDLGPLNIMRFQAELIAVDWEDVFFGIKDYDYLYWLTFIENRIYLDQDPLRHITTSKTVAKSIMIIIIILKSEIARRSNALKYHTISVNDRINEVTNKIV